MRTADFSTKPDVAYTLLGTKPAGQNWFAFDISMDEARRKTAKRFVMTVWNSHLDKATGVFSSWGIRHDPRLGQYWYQVPWHRNGSKQNKRTALWNAIEIAQAKGIQMQAVLKDSKTRRCSLDDVYEISQVVYEQDGSALWLKLDIGERGVGTEVMEQSLSHLEDLDLYRPRESPEKRVAKVKSEQYMAACDYAAQVFLKTISRSGAIEELSMRYGLKAGTASVFINNYRCVATGAIFKAPMSVDAIRYFTHRIIARHGDLVIPKIVLALQGYVAYASKTWEAVPPDVLKLLADLDSDRQAVQANEILEKAAKAALTPAQASADSRPTEILRLIWARGPQHREFRKALEERWKDSCSVHGVSCNGQLRASHIVAWRLSEELRGDVNNGLLLSVPLDSLFDCGLISFSPAGEMLMSRNLDENTQLHFGLKRTLRLNWSHLSERERNQIRKNLTKHRNLYMKEHHYKSAK